MSAVILRNTLDKSYFKSLYHIRRNFRTVAHSGFLNESRKLLFKKQVLPGFYCVFRDMSSKSLTIKQYQSNRKYTLTWKLERLMGWSLIILIPMTFAIESKLLEMTLGTTALLHTYWGCQSICSDYLRSHVVGKILPVVVRLSIVIFSLGSLAGLYQLVYEDIGFISMIKKFWSIRGKDYVPPKDI